MSVTVAQATTLLENILFESASLAATNADYWVNQSASVAGDASLLQLAAAMANSAEAGIADEVVRLYYGALGRTPSGAEVLYYVGIAEGGRTSAQIAGGTGGIPQTTWNSIATDFVDSPEFTSNASTGSAQITLFYENILGRAPSANELTFYQNQLASGLTSANLLQEFINSPEYANKVDPGIVNDLAQYGVSVANGVVPRLVDPILDLTHANAGGNYYTPAVVATLGAGFTTLGIGDGGNNADLYDMHAVFTGYQAIDVITASGISDSFTNVAAGTSLQIEGNAALLSYSLYTATKSGAVTVILGNAETTGATGLTVNDLVLTDTANDGIASVNFELLNQSGGANVLTTVTDSAASFISISGSGSLSIGTLALTGPGLSIDDSSSAASPSLIGSLSDSNLTNLALRDAEGSGVNGLTITNLAIGGSTDLLLINVGAGALSIGTLQSTGALDNLTLSGAAPITIGNLAGLTTATVSIANTGTSTATIDAGSGSSFSDSSMTTLNLSGNIAISVTAADTSGVTVNGGGDNSAVSLTLTGASSSDTDTITLGSGHDTITDNSTAGSLKITVGSGTVSSGSAIITVDSGNASTFSAAILLGVHSAATGSDEIFTSVISASATSPNTVITNVVAGDQVVIADGTAVTFLTATQQTAVTALATLAEALAYVDGGTASLPAQTAVTFYYGNNTYIVESHAAGNGTLTASDSFIELVGVHSLSSTVSNHIFTVAS
jgi:hypothetical protein